MCSVAGRCSHAGTPGKEWPSVEKAEKEVCGMRDYIEAEVLPFMQMVPVLLLLLLLFLAELQLLLSRPVRVVQLFVLSSGLL